MNCSFTLSHYEECLSKFLESNFKTLSIEDFFLKNFLDSEKHLIMRHDVDHDISLLENMIEIESNLGIRSSIYFRARAKNYNLFSRESSRIVQKSLSLGHSVGFHYEDVDLEKNRVQFIVEALRREHGEETFKTVSPHEPSRTGKLSYDWSQIGVIGDSYDESLMSYFKYISDSSCRWREGCMHNFTKSEKSMYILTHPIWWYKKHPGENY